MKRAELKAVQLFLSAELSDRLHGGGAGSPMHRRAGWGLGRSARLLCFPAPGCAGGLLSWWPPGFAS